jgi:hypothetical protein
LGRNALRRRCQNALVAQLSNVKTGPGVDIALRRVVLGFRVIAVLWLSLLAIVVLVTGDPGLAP